MYLFQYLDTIREAVAGKKDPSTSLAPILDDAVCSWLVRNQVLRNFTVKMQGAEGKHNKF